MVKFSGFGMSKVAAHHVVPYQHVDSRSPRVVDFRPDWRPGGRNPIFDQLLAEVRAGVFALN